jgi:Glutamine synthetase, beta-Grasp domain
MITCLVKNCCRRRTDEQAQNIWDNKSLEFIQMRYTDVLGKSLARYLSMPPDIEDFFRHGIGLDGSSVRGFAHIDDSDLLLLPDRTTARTVPVSKEGMIGTVIADVFEGTEGRDAIIGTPVDDIIDSKGASSTALMKTRAVKERSSDLKQKRDILLLYTIIIINYSG